MATKIPSKKLVSSIIKDILTKKGVIVTLNKLQYLVYKELKQKSLYYSISLTRLKKIVLEVKEIQVKIKKRKDRSRRTLTVCPVCKKEITKIFGRNVFSKKIHAGYKCKNCGFNADLNSTTPREYIFVLTK